MKYITIFLCLFIAGCTSVPLPELGTKKQAGKTYEAQQTRFCGIDVGKPYWKEVPSRSAVIRATLAVPAKWTLYICVPVGLLAGAAMLWLSSTPPVMQKLGALCGICLTASVGAGAWLYASAYPLVFIPIIGAAIFVGYRKTKHKKLTLTEATHDR